MAYVVARRGGRFEIRESLSTPDGPRSRTLANFDRLTAEVMDKAERRSSRPFDRHDVLASAKRAHAPIEIEDRYSRFVTISRRLGRQAERRHAGHRTEQDPGAALIDLMSFAEEVARHQPARRKEPLAYPVLADLAHSK